MVEARKGRVRNKRIHHLTEIAQEDIYIHLYNSRGMGHREQTGTQRRGKKQR